MFRTQRHGEHPVPVPGIRAGDVCSWQGKHRKHCKRRGALALVARGRLFGRKSGGLESHHVSRSRVGTLRRARQFHHTRIFPGDSEPAPPFRGGRIADPRERPPFSTTRRSGVSESRKNWRARSFSWHATLRAASSLVQISVWTAGSFVRRSDSRVAGNVSLRDFSSSPREHADPGCLVTSRLIPPSELPPRPNAATSQQGPYKHDKRRPFRVLPSRSPRRASQHRGRARAWRRVNPRRCHRPPPRR